jgi:hypothetical protein
MLGPYKATVKRPGQGCRRAPLRRTMAAPGVGPCGPNSSKEASWDPQCLYMNSPSNLGQGSKPMGPTSANRSLSCTAHPQSMVAG